MAELEVAASVSAVVSALHAGAELVKQVSKRQKRRKSEQAFKEKTLLESLETGESQIEKRFARDCLELGEEYRAGDKIARDRVQRIAVVIQAEIIRSLQIASQNEKAILNLIALHEATVMNRRDTITALDDLRQRILENRYNSPISPATISNSASMAPEIIPLNVTIPERAESKESKSTFGLSLLRYKIKGSGSPNTNATPAGRVSVASSPKWMASGSPGSQQHPASPWMGPIQPMGFPGQNYENEDPARPISGSITNRFSISQYQYGSYGDQGSGSESLTRSNTSSTSSRFSLSRFSSLRSNPGLGRSNTNSSTSHTIPSMSSVHGAPFAIEPDSDLYTDLAAGHRASQSVPDAFPPSKASSVAQPQLSPASPNPGFWPPPLQFAGPTPAPHITPSALPAVPGPAMSTAMPKPVMHPVVLDKPCKENNYHGFCKSAWSIREELKKGMSIQTIPQGLYNTVTIWRCKTCSFTGECFGRKKSYSVDTKLYTTPSGIRYRWIFLAKSHAKKKVHDQLPGVGEKGAAGNCSYGCMFCCVEGRTSGLFGNVETLMGHIRDEHSYGISDQVQKSTRCIYGREPKPGEVFDVYVPALAELCSHS